MSRGRSQGNYTNPCLTMHQPWASLLVYGIKRIEGRSWPAPITGRLWIHAASKIPEEATIKAMEDFYREIYAVNGITDLKFPLHYPVSRLIGCVEVVGCVRCEELASWEALPEGVRLEGQTDFCWLCEQPQKLLIPFEMRGYQGVYNLEKKIFESAVRGLTPVKGPLPVKFPLPNPRDPFSLKPGSISVHFPETKVSVVEKSSSLSVAIAGARAAATQFNKKDQNLMDTIPSSTPNSTKIGQSKRKSLEEDNMPPSNLIEGPNKGISTSIDREQSNPVKYVETSYHNQPREDLKPHPGPPSKEPNISKKKKSERPSWRNQTMSRGRSQGNYTNPCLTMHQPWASLLVYGIKRIEGRSWPAPITGRLWIHAASKIPEEATIKAMEDFYREIYAVNGITDLKFPLHYPVSRLIGCVEVVGCVRCEELASWEALPEGVRLEGQTDFCWLCEQPQKLLIPFEMRGYQGVYNLEKKIFESAVRGLTPVKGPLPVKFPLPNPRDPLSLKPGSISVHFPETKVSVVEKSSRLNAAIAGARAAATQFNKKDQNLMIPSQVALPIP